MAAVIAVALILAGFLSWYVLFSPLTVSIAPIETNVHEQVYALGVVGARVQSSVGFKVAGVLVELKADQGDRVRAGQVLARLDVRDVEAQLALARAGVGQARANIEKAKADVVSANTNRVDADAIAGRRAALVKNGYTTVEETQTTDTIARVAAANLVSAQSGLTVAEAVLQSAEAQQAFEEVTLSYYTLYAPYDAWIVSRDLELGSAFNPINSGRSGQSVFTLVAAHTIWAVSYVDERLAGQLSLGQPAEIVLRSDPNKRIPGHVERIEIQSDPVNEERLVDVAFAQMPPDIHLAEQAYVYITHEDITPCCFGFAGRLARRQVAIGPQLLDGRLPIRDGLPANAAIVAAPVSGLRIGRVVRIVEASRG
ncbi:efflux RND transporter periplasmic adaptor subunit [Bradyrhizobium sp.]|uniref:efflux RND transporter periplasmic adaptor subunit n=1 Tax=Bradyrhizobium sp. TaxID=376 RepID=UPI003C71F169